MAIAVRVRVGCEFTFQAAAMSHTVIQVEPSRIDRISILREQWNLVPDASRRGYRDVYGNLCQRVQVPPGAFTVRYDALVEVPRVLDDMDESAREVPAELLPDEVLVYTLPSRYCLSDELADEAWRRFGTVAPGWGRVQAVCDFVHSDIRFQYGTSSPRTTAVDVYRNKIGVCRDFTHLAISFCRAMNIPARYAFGYLPDIDIPPDPAEMDFAAWMEVWLEGRWYTFDPRNNHRRIGRVLVGRGRDALDCAMLTSYGNAGMQSMVVWADEEPVDRGGQPK
jgi:transglutaminase-like putative cysteine protease